MNNHLQRLKERTLELRDVCSPKFFRLEKEDDRKKFTSLVESGSVFLNDEIYDQLRELVKARNASRVLNDQDYTSLIEKHLNGRDINEYGVWVYYPWSNSLVHTLDEEEFVEMRTSRNQYKISPEEKKILATKKVGVIGLSVGQSVAVTMAMERTCGELRLADFDALELTNLNRIRTGIKNLGLKKVVSVAREIVEIDPYFKVIIYPDGISKENIHGFFCDNGKLDLVIDECDGLDIKIQCRIVAKSYQIPVVMEASDRGTVDVERYDLEPHRSILHGLIDHLDISKVGDLKTNEEKVPYILPIAGMETISTRAKASMIEVGQTITTWPQLASAVTLGGGIVTDVCRRIFLDEYHDSGRYFIDIEELICDKKKTHSETHRITPTEGASERVMDELIKQLDLRPADKQATLTKSAVEELVQSAIMAPTGGNAQPWKWKWDGNNLYLFIHSDYEPKLADFRDTSSLIGLGAASENLVLKAHSMGLEVLIKKFPLGANSPMVAAFQFFDKKNADGIKDAELHIADALVTAIPDRHANRKVTPRQVIERGKLDKLVQIAQSVPGCQLRLTTDPNDIATLSDIIGRANRIRVMMRNGHLEFMEEVKWSEEEALKSRKGIDITTLDLTPGQMVGFKLVRHWEVVDYLNKWNGGSGLERMTHKAANAASAIGLITMPSFTPDNFFDGGRAVERAWLAATNENVAFSPLSISTFLFNRLVHEGRDAFPEKVANELSEMRDSFKRIFSLDDSTGEILMFRLFISEPASKHALRMHVSDVLSFGQ